MKFIKKRRTVLHINQNGSGYIMPALAALCGVISALFFLKNEGSAVISLIKTSLTPVCGCILIIFLISVSGLCLVGPFLIFCLDFLYGFIASVCAHIGLQRYLPFSGVWFFWAFSVFALIFFALLVSEYARKFSTELYKRVKAEGKFKAKLIKYYGICTAVILIIASAFFAAYSLKPGLFI